MLLSILKILGINIIIAILGLLVFTSHAFAVWLPWYLTGFVERQGRDRLR